MEELLNKLIQRWWKPFGKTWINERDAFVYMNKWHCIRLHKWVYANNILCWQYDLRQIVSKESWLRQFCCDKWLVEMYEWWYWQNICPLDSKEYDYTDYQYWILESSLIDEDKLDKFLIDNIKI